MVQISVLLSLPLAMAAVPFKFWDQPHEVFIGCEKYIDSIVTFSNERHVASYWCGDSRALKTMIRCLLKSGLPFGQAEAILEEKCHLGVQTFNERLLQLASQEPEGSVSIDGESITMPESNESISLNETKILESKEKNVLFYEMKDRAMYYGIVLNCYWLVVFLAASIINWSLALFPSLHSRIDGKVAKWVRGYFTLPALGKSHRMLSKRVLGFIHFYSPSRMESSIIGLFIILSLLLCSINYPSPDATVYFHPKTKDYVHYVANRSAIMATTLMPLVFLLSGRNNLLQWSAQWDHSTFLLYHRWVARVASAGVFIHSVAASLSLNYSGIYHEVMKSWYVIWGIVGTLACAFLVVSSFLYFRRHFYETFFAMHLISAIVFLIGSWYHLERLGYSFLMTISVSLFLGDRVLRYIRLLCFGFPSGKITLHGDETLRVEVPRPSYYVSLPGGHGWLTFGRYFWQAHPFSCIDSPTKPNTVVFLCGVKSGVTRRIAQKVRSSPEHSLQMRVAMEGVYGRLHSIRGYDSIIFIAGGRGFPGIFSEAYAKSQQCMGGPEKVKFIWITTHSASLDCCAEELQALGATGVETAIYFTRENEKSAVDDANENELSFKALCGQSLGGARRSRRLGPAEKFPHIDFYFYKPIISEIVASETEQCKKSIAFVSCGHPAMVDAMRVSVVSILRQSKKRVDYYDQLQGWA